MKFPWQLSLKSLDQAPPLGKVEWAHSTLSFPLNIRIKPGHELWILYWRNLKSEQYQQCKGKHQNLEYWSVSELSIRPCSGTYSRIVMPLETEGNTDSSGRALQFWLKGQERELLILTEHAEVLPSFLPWFAPQLPSDPVVVAAVAAAIVGAMGTPKNLRGNSPCFPNLWFHGWG